MPATSVTGRGRRSSRQIRASIAALNAGDADVLRVPGGCVRDHRGVATEDEGFRTALREAVRRALASHGGELVAEVVEGVNAPHGVWRIDVTPKQPGAAFAYITPGDGGEEVTEAPQV